MNTITATQESFESTDIVISGDNSNTSSIEKEKIVKSRCKRARVDQVELQQKQDAFGLLKEARDRIVNKSVRDEYSVFGEYVANELRTTPGERNQLLLKKKIQDVIFYCKLQNLEQKEQACASSHQTFTPLSQTFSPPLHSHHQSTLQEEFASFNPITAASASQSSYSNNVLSPDDY